MQSALQTQIRDTRVSAPATLAHPTFLLCVAVHFEYSVNTQLKLCIH